MVCVGDVHRRMDRAVSRVEEEAEGWTGQPQELNKKQKDG